MSDGPVKPAKSAPPLDDIILEEDELADDAPTHATARLAHLHDGDGAERGAGDPDALARAIEAGAPVTARTRASSVPDALSPAADGHGDVRASQRPRDRSSNRVKAADPARKRSKLTLRIPDDEVSRPQLPDSRTPIGGVPAVTGSTSGAGGSVSAPPSPLRPSQPPFVSAPPQPSRPPTRPPSPSRPPSDPDMEPLRPNRIISVNPPPPADLDPEDTLVLSREELEARGRALQLDDEPGPAPGIDAGPQEQGWTPYQPMVVDRADLPPVRSNTNTLPGITTAGGNGGLAGTEAPALARIPIRDPQRTMIDEDGTAAMALIRKQHDGHVDSAPPVSEDIPIDTDEEESTRSFEDAATNPRLPVALDSEEIKIEEGERVTDPGDVAEVDADDLVSIESIPMPQHPPPLKGGKGSPSTPPVAITGITATSLMSGAAAPAPAAPAPLSSTPNPLGPNALTPVAPAVAARTPSVPAPAPSPAPSAISSATSIPAPVTAATAFAVAPLITPATPSQTGASNQPGAVSAPPAQPSGPKLELSLPDAPPPPAASALAARTQRRAQAFGGYSANVGALAPPPMNEAAANRKKVRPWWEDLFNDDFIRTMAKITDGDIAREASFIEESLGCEAGATILDLACGTGRHSVELASRGYQVVGFDLSLAMLARASDEAQDRKQKINFVQGDMREMTFDETFDGVFSWNTSFGYFEDEKNAAVIAKVHRSLKKGGQFLLDVVNRDSIIRQAPSLAWFEGDGCICMDEMQIDFITSRMKVKRTLMMDDGRTKEIEYSIRIYSLHELGKMLHDNGFRVAEVSGGTGTPGVFFGCEAPRTLILAEKR